VLTPVILATQEAAFRRVAVQGQPRQIGCKILSQQYSLKKWADAQRRETKATEANKRRGPGTREKFRSRRINLEGNTHAQEVNVSNSLYSYPYLN
jgi:hypothetical protein